MVSLSLFSGYAISPFYSTWIANAVPENIRARFASRQTIVSTIVAMIAGFAIGQFLDFFPDSGGFVWVFAVWVALWILGLSPTYSARPFPQQTTASDEQSTRLRDLCAALLRRQLPPRRALFFGLWTFGIGLAGPLYSVFHARPPPDLLHRDLDFQRPVHADQHRLAIGLWAGLIDRFGARPVLQILMTPAVFLPLVSGPLISQGITA